WLRYVPLPESARRAYAHAVRAIVVQGGAATDGVIAAELRRGLSGLLAAEVPRWDSVTGDGAVVVGTPSGSPLVAALGWAALGRGDELPDRVDPRVLDYARANASIGINGTVINSVNADPASLTAPYLDKTAALADALRPYGIRVYLSANFAAPRLLAGPPTADPLDPTVAKWWRDKTDEIYRLIPDLGGFLVKANSEGQPGPPDDPRTP